MHLRNCALWHSPIQRHTATAGKHNRQAAMNNRLVFGPRSNCGYSTLTASFVSRSKQSWLSLISAFSLLFLIRPIAVAAVLHCLQCSPSPEAIQLPGSKRQLRLTTGLREPRCPKEIQIICEDGRDVCVSQFVKAGSHDWWIAKGCDYSYDYDKLGCESSRVSRSERFTALGAATQDSKDSFNNFPAHRTCVCKSNNCNPAVGIHQSNMKMHLLSTSLSVQLKVIILVPVLAAFIMFNVVK